MVVTLSQASKTLRDLKSMVNGEAVPIPELPDNNTHESEQVKENVSRGLTAPAPKDAYL